MEKPESYTRMTQYENTISGITSIGIIFIILLMIWLRNYLHVFLHSEILVPLYSILRDIIILLTIIVLIQILHFIDYELLDFIQEYVNIDLLAVSVSCLAFCWLALAYY